MCAVGVKRGSLEANSTSSRLLQGRGPSLLCAVNAAVKHTIRLGTLPSAFAA